MLVSKDGRSLDMHSRVSRGGKGGKGKGGGRARGKGSSGNPRHRPEAHATELEERPSKTRKMSFMTETGAVVQQELDEHTVEVLTSGWQV